MLKHQADLLSEESGCPAVFDLVSCWPKTPLATLAVLPCFDEFKGVRYDTTQNATRYCHLDGNWDNYTNYEKCHHIVHPSDIPAFEPSIELPIIIYFIGYTLTLLSLTLAVSVFLYFKDLRCLRNTIHVNLFITYILSSCLWIMILTLQMTIKHEIVGCIFLVILFHYFFLTNFFWMLVEGLYLYTLVVQTFSGSLRYEKYALIGWVLPAIFVTIWAIVKPFSTSSEIHQPTKLEIECSWMREAHIDWIVQAPACAVLIINLIFLIKIMWVLITKLRSANTIETRQYRKASKALLVLIPLLGITYLVVIYGPEDEGVGRQIFSVTRALLLSTQGFVVAVFYCFLHSDVQQTLRHRFYRWRDEKNIRAGKFSNNRRPTMSKDYSPRSRTESIRLTTITPSV